MKSRILFGIGSVFIVGGILSNQWVLARMLTSDETIVSFSLKTRILLLEIFLIVAGYMLIHFRQVIVFSRQQCISAFVGGGCIIAGIVLHEWIVISWFGREAFFIKIGVWLFNSLLIGVGSFILYTNNDRLASNISLLLSTCVVCMFILEGTLRWLSPPAIAGVGTEQTPKARLYGWTLPPNTRMSFTHPDTGAVSFFTTNSQGWKDVEHTFEKPKKTFRILFLGDSNTYGIVPLEDLYTRKVERLLRDQGFPHVEVISIGIGGWGTDQALEALIHEGLHYAPDLVIYQFCGNDPTDNLPPINPNDPQALQLKKPFRYQLTAQGLARIPQEVSKSSIGFRQKIQDLVEQSMLIYHLNRLRLYIASRTSPSASQKTSFWWESYPLDPTSPYFLYQAGKETPEMKSAWDLLEAIIVEMKIVTEQRGARFLIFSEESDSGKRAWYIEWQKILTDATGDSVFWKQTRYPIDWQYPLKRLTTICQRRDIGLIRPVRSYSRYRYDPHPDTVGNMHMAYDIVDFLKEQHLLPQNKS